MTVWLELGSSSVTCGRARERSQGGPRFGVQPGPEESRRLPTEQADSRQGQTPAAAKALTLCSGLFYNCF